jgi:curved DNA-binding protein CbpA
MSSDQPTTTGTFGKTPLPHVLVSLLERSSTGTLVIETGDSVRSALYVDCGVPTKMRLGTPEARLGEVLVELGYLKSDVAETTYAQAVEKHQLHGKTLVETGLLDDSDLPLALRTQLVKKLQLAATLPPSTVFGFYDGSDYLSKWRSGPNPTSPLVVAWALARSHADMNVIATVVHRIENYPLRLHPQAQVRSFGFNRSELTLLDVIRARPQTIESLRRMGLVSPHTLERIIYVLSLTRHLDFGRNLTPLGLGAVNERDEQLLEPKESIRPSRPVVLGTPSNPENASPSEHVPNKRTPSQPASIHDERRLQLEKWVQTAETQTYFELLGVPTDASTTTVQEAYLKLAKTFHPDRLPTDLADLKPLATKIFAKISEAHQVLSDPEKRSAYVESLRHVGEESEEEKVRRILRATSAFQKAEVLLKKRMIAAAELEVKRALEDDPEQPDYLALHAWIQSTKTDSAAHLPGLLKTLSDAVTRNPASEKNRYYRVQLLKRLDRIDEAVADCRIIVEKNPHHVDALREIRLWEMRRTAARGTAPKTTPSPDRKSSGTKTQSKPTTNLPSSSKHDEPSPTGLLGRFFKR